MGNFSHVPDMISLWGWQCQPDIIRWCVMREFKALKFCLTFSGFPDIANRSSGSALECLAICSVFCYCYGITCWLFGNWAGTRSVYKKWQRRKNFFSFRRIWHDASASNDHSKGLLGFWSTQIKSLIAMSSIHQTSCFIHSKNSSSTFCLLCCSGAREKH